MACNALRTAISGAVFLVFTDCMIFLRCWVTLNSGFGMEFPWFYAILT